MRYSVTFLMLLSLAACGGSNKTNGTGGGSTGAGSTGNDNNISDPNAETTPTGPNVDFSSGFVHFYGRVDKSAAGGVLLSWPGTGAVVRVTQATSVSATIAPRQHGEYDRVSFYLDGKLAGDVNLNNHYGPTPYKIAIPTTGEHYVTIIKRTEAGDGGALLSEITTDGQFEKASDTTRLIEYIGDNVTAGFNVDGPATVTSGSQCQTSAFDSVDYIANPNFENAMHAYPVLTSQSLSADWSVLAVTTRGVTQNYDGSRGVTLRSLYPLVDPLDSNNIYSGQAPDVVVLNVGASDSSYWFANKVAPDEATFEANLSGLISDIHQRYAKAFIIVTYGPTLTDTQALTNGVGSATEIANLVQAAVNQAQSAGATNVSIAAFQPSSEFTCDYYPDQTAQQSLAQQLAPVITKLTGWGAAPTMPPPAKKGLGPQHVVQTFDPLPDPLANAGDPNATGISMQEFPQCHVCSPQPYAQGISGCGTLVGESEPCQGYCHVPDTFTEKYFSNPPTSGNHYPEPEATLGEHTSTVMRGHYLHSMEHGAVVIAYNCPQGCDADLAAVRGVVQSFVKGDPTVPSDSNNTWVILTPDPLLVGTNFAALSWTYSYKFNTADTAALSCFIRQHVYYGRECTATTTTERTDWASSGCSMLSPHPMASVTK